MIDCKCVRNNCESKRRIYVFYSEIAPPEEVIDTVLATWQNATCGGGHEMQLDETSVTVERLPD
jgi:hypothetical protein